MDHEEKKTERITVRLAPTDMRDLIQEAKRLKRDEAWLARDYIEKALAARLRKKPRPK